MSKLRLDKFLNMGYSLVIGDVVTKLTGDTLAITKANLTIYNNPKHYGTDRRFVHSLCMLDMNEIIDLSAPRNKQGKAAVPKRMKVEYVKVNKNIEGGKYWECVKDYAETEGDIFFAAIRGEVIDKVASHEDLLVKYKSNNLYRKVEIEMDLKQEQRKDIARILSGNDKLGWIGMAKALQNAGLLADIK